MKKNSIGLRREDLSKKGEKRSAISPAIAQFLHKEGCSLYVQSRKHPETGEVKRAYYDKKFTDAGAILTEDLTPARVIFGLKEIDMDQILEGKAYLFFSHTHKGQRKNRKMLKTLAEKKTTVIDYELITDEEGSRLVTAFTYFAGYAGMIDSLWMLGKRLMESGIENPFSHMKQSKDFEDMHAAKEALRTAGDRIRTEGTPGELPPFIVSFLGSGKTSHGAQKMFDLLPHHVIHPHEVEETFRNGDRNRIYKVVYEIPDMYRLKADAGNFEAVYRTWPDSEKRDLYMKQPERFESNLDRLLPYTPCS